MAKDSRYRWVILGVSVVMMFEQGLLILSVPYLLDNIRLDLNLTYLEAGVLAGAVFIGYVLYGPLGGASTDRLGVRRGILLSAVIVTVASLLRSESVGFVDFLAYSSLFSVGIVMQIAGITRQIFEWFPSRMVATANGIWNAGFGIGALLASGLTQGFVLPLMGGWRNVLLFYALTSFIGLFLWLGLARDAPVDPSEAGSKPAGSRGSLQSLVRNKNFWLLFIAFGVMTGAQNGSVSWIPTILLSRGLTVGGLIGVLLWLGAIIGTVLLPSLSDLLGRRRPVILAMSLVLGASVYYLGSSAWPWMALPAFLVGFNSSPMYPFALTLVGEIRDVPRNTIARAVGFMMAATGLGSVILPSMGGLLRDLTGSFGVVMVSYSAVALVAIPAVLLLMETSARRLS
ncbi:MAG: MFS transporter [Thaumarchaeota archaeon]|nr:MAG: MFS transporter [Nitrososphaerota archaeon]